jgi:PAS domain S-box-containing protein
VINWAIVGVVYAAAYVLLTTLLAGQGYTRTVAGNIGLLLPPFSLLIAVARRRRDWRGRHAVFWAAIGAWPLVWLIGQTAWSSDELLRSNLLPWFKWPIIMQLCASALPLLALVAWPHRGTRSETASTVALDIAVLVFLTASLYWSLIIAPGMDPAHNALALRSLAMIGPLVRLAAVAGLFAASAGALRAGEREWAIAYQRIAFGMLAAFAVLIGMSMLAVRGEYQTGSPADIGWMLPFFFAAWSASTAPASKPETRASSRWGNEASSPMLVLIALLAVPIIGYGSIALMPLGGRVDRLRELATVITLVGGIALVMLRLRVERLAVARANERLRLLATACEQAGELIVIVRQHRILYANDAFCTAVGYSRDELEQIRTDSLVAEESRADLPALRQQLQSKQLVRANSVMNRRDGTTFPASWVSAPILDAAGRVTHIVAVVRDMTEDVRLRSQIVRGERLSAIGEFVSGVAHEINNPLQSILGTLELLLADHSDDPELRADLERATWEASRAGRIVRNLLAFVRQSPTERILIDINETVKATVAIRAYEFEVAGIKVVEEYASGLPLVQASRDEIQQVIAHLLINARQAMAESEGPHMLTVRTHLLDGNAVVDVLDTGPGIPEAIAGRIFEPFFTTKTPGASTGLGLSMSLGIAHAHRGDLEIVPSPRGSCFRLTLPGAGFPGPVVTHTQTPISFGGPM